MAKLQAWDILGKERFKELLDDGVSKEAIVKMAKEQYNEVVSALGKEKYKHLRSGPFSWSDIEKYAKFDRARSELNTQNEWNSVDEYGNPVKKSAPTKEDIKAYEKSREKEAVNPKAFKDVGYLTSEEKLKDDYKKELSSIENPVAKVASKWYTRAIGGTALADNKNTKIDSLHKTNFDNIIAETRAWDEIEQEEAAKHRDIEQQKAYEKAEKAYEKADSFLDTATAGGKLLYLKAKNPKEWDVPGIVADVANPVNWVGFGSGKVAGAFVSGVAKKAVAGAVAGAAGDGAINAGISYLQAKSKGASDEEAKKAAIVGGVAGAAMGAPLGSVGGVFSKSIREKFDAKVEENPNIVNDEATVKQQSNKSETAPNSERFKELLDNELLQIDEVESVSNNAYSGITELAKSAKSVDELNAKAAQFFPPTHKEVALTMALNDGQNVTPRFAGFRLRGALAYAVEHSNKSPDEIKATLLKEGLSEELANVVTVSYAKRDLTLFDNYVSDKLSDIIDTHIIEKTKELEWKNDANRDTRENREQNGRLGSSRDNTELDTVRAKDATDTKQSTVSRDSSGGDEAIRNARLDSSKDSSDVGVPKKDERMVWNK